MGRSSRWYSNMAYLPQYNDSRHSSTADDASVAAAFQQELDAENRQYSKPKENTLRDSDVARKFQQEENSKAEGSFKVVSQKRVAYRVSANFTDVTHDLPGLNPGAVVNGCAVRGRDGLAYIRIQVAGAKLYVPAFMQEIAGDRGSSVAKPSGPTTVAKNQTYRVIYRNGCAFRNSPQWADRWAVHAPNVPSDCGPTSVPRF